MTLALAAAVVLVAGVVAADRWVRAARTRRQTVDALAAVPAAAGVDVPDVADLAPALATRLGLPAAEVAAVATVARLHGLGALAPAAAVGRLATESGLSPFVTTVLYEALTTSGGGVGPAAAVVRVSLTYQRLRAEPHLTSAGALFGTVRAHPSGMERLVAAELVRFVQRTPP